MCRPPLALLATLWFTTAALALAAAKRRDFTVHRAFMIRSYVLMNERGHFFSEGNYDILGAPITDGYDAMASGGSNLGVTSQSANQTITTRLQAVRIPGTRVPIDLITASGSGLDPHLSPEAALYQAGRVAAARQLRRERVEQLVRDHVEGPTAGLLGAPRVNVLRLNLALDAQTAD